MTDRNNSQDIGIELGLGKYAMFIIKRGKRQKTEGIKVSILEKRKFGERENYNYVGRLEADTIKQVEINEKN